MCQCVRTDACIQTANAEVQLLTVGSPACGPLLGDPSVSQGVEGCTDGASMGGCMGMGCGMSAVLEPSGRHGRGVSTSSPSYSISDLWINNQIAQIVVSMQLKPLRKSGDAVSSCLQNGVEGGKPDWGVEFGAK